MSNLIGGNGQGFFQNLDDQTKTWLSECFADRPFCINFPGGAEANIATPNKMLKGWGLTEQIINDRFGAGQPDENGEGLDKWLGKLSQQNSAPRSYIYELQDFVSQFPKCEVIWKANIVTSTLDDAKSSFAEVKDVSNFTRCVMGNEVYSKGNFSFDFNAFLAKAQPLMEWVKEHYPDVKIAVPFAPNISRGDHMKWNTALIEFVNTTDLVDAVDVHIYLGSDELVDAYATYPVSKIKYEEGKFYPELSCFDTFCDEYKTNTTWEDTLGFIEQNLPTKEIWMTEFSTNPSGNFGNSFANAAFIFNRFMKYSHRIANMCVHNLVSPDIYGTISRTDKFDTGSTLNTRRTGYYALKLASIALDKGAIPLSPNQTITQNGVYWLDNSSDEQFEFTVNAGSGKLLDTLTINSFDTTYTYLSIGKVGYISNTTPPFDNEYELSYETSIHWLNSASDVTIMQTSFGVYEYTVKNAPPPPPAPCKRKWFQFWLPKCNTSKISESVRL